MYVVPLLEWGFERERMGTVPGGFPGADKERPELVQGVILMSGEGISPFSKR